MSKEAIDRGIGPWLVDIENKRVFRFVGMKLHEALCAAVVFCD